MVEVKIFRLYNVIVTQVTWTLTDTKKKNVCVCFGDFFVWSSLILMILCHALKAVLRMRCAEGVSALTTSGSAAGAAGSLTASERFETGEKLFEDSGRAKRAFTPVSTNSRNEWKRHYILERSNTDFAMRHCDLYRPLVAPCNTAGTVRIVCCAEKDDDRKNKILGLQCCHKNLSD